MAKKAKPKCGAHWCNRPTHRASHGISVKVAGVDTCKACHEYARTKAKKLGKSMHEIFFQLPAPYYAPPKVRVGCARENCPVIFKKGEGSITKDGKHGRVYIGGKPVCHACYQTTIELSQAKGISLIDAFALLPPKGVRRVRHKK